jgi:hypothetical protein
MSHLFENLGVDIAQLINDELGPSLLPATLTVTTPGTRTSNNLAAGTNPTSVAYSARGFVAELDKTRPAGTTVQVTGRTVVLLGKSISGGTVAPKAGDLITIEGVQGKVVGVPERDPAAATWSCRVMP